MCREINENMVEDYQTFKLAGYEPQDVYNSHRWDGLILHANAKLVGLTFYSGLTWLITVLSKIFYKDFLYLP